MSSHDRSVANPDRTHVDDDGQMAQEAAHHDEGEDEVHETHQRNDPHDQPWPAVAKEVKQAVEDADGPLD
jgi:hypothetical protein